jgi:septal ring factor EnvC (AmiA/AmiB activator)
MNGPDRALWRAATRIAETSEPIRIDQPSGPFFGRVPIAVFVSLLLQAGLLIWWAAAMSARFDERLNQFQERLQKLEATAQRSSDSDAAFLDRLARVEEKIATQADRIRRLEQAR